MRDHNLGLDTMHEVLKHVLSSHLLDLKLNLHLLRKERYFVLKGIAGKEQSLSINVWVHYLLINRKGVLHLAMFDIILSFLVFSIMYCSNQSAAVPLAFMLPPIAYRFGLVEGDPLLGGLMLCTYFGLFPFAALSLRSRTCILSFCH
jgi:hypothetical protein